MSPPKSTRRWASESRCTTRRKSACLRRASARHGITWMVSSPSRTFRSHRASSCRHRRRRPGRARRPWRLRNRPESKRKNRRDNEWRSRKVSPRADRRRGAIRPATDLRFAPKRTPDGTIQPAAAQVGVTAAPTPVTAAEVRLRAGACTKPTASSPATSSVQVAGTGTAVTTSPAGSSKRAPLALKLRGGPGVGEKKGVGKNEGRGHRTGANAAMSSNAAERMCLFMVVP